MWVRDINTGRWSVYTDELSKDNYDNLKQDLESIKFYSNCLSGSTYLLINKFDNIYETLSYKDNKTWYISTLASNYTSSLMPFMNGSPINRLTIDEYFDKYVKDYGFSLKTLFTPDKLIKESAENFIELDAATYNIGALDGTNNIDLETVVINLTIDGVRLKEGHRILVKDQITTVELATSVDPDSYFTCPYYILSDNTTSITYYYYNQENGVYTYHNNMLTRDTDLSSYDDSYNFSVIIKMGDNNREKQFHLSRKLNGYYPLVSESDPIEFVEKHNWVLRNRVDYNNILDVNYYDVLKHATQSYNYDSHTYSIPQRTVAVGEFGVIINNQDKISGGQTYSFSHLMNNRYKVNLRGVSQTSRFYWVCGDEGTLLKISKVDFSISKIDLGELKELRSVSFYNDSRGVVVGRFNSIYYTEDGGYRWKKLEFPEYDSYSYNKILFSDLDRFFVIGENGIFIEFTSSGGQWISYLRKITKKITDDDIYPLVDDLNDIIKTTFTSWSLTYSTTQSSHTISTTKEALMMCGSNDNLIVYDYNNFVNEHDFIYLGWTTPIGDIKSLSRRMGTDEVYITSDSVYKFNINEFEEIGVVSNSITSVGVRRYRTQILGSAYLAVNVGDWTQIPVSSFGLTPSLPTYPTGKDWWYDSPGYFAVDYEFTTTNSWTKALAYTASVQLDSIIDFYAPIIGYWEGSQQEIDYPNFRAELVGFMDPLWLVGQRENGDWELITKMDQVLDVPTGDPAYSLRSYRVSENYQSIGLILNETSHADKISEGRSPSAPRFEPRMGEIIEFNVTVDKPTRVADYYVNKIIDFEGSENIIAGNEALLRSNDYLGNTYSLLDPTLNSKLKSKMLFLDYDVASKLNFFDDNGEYRLPNSVTFSSTSITTSTFSVSNVSGEYNWLNYYKDSEKTFIYYSSFVESNRVEFSTTFSYHLHGVSTFTFSKSSLSTNLVDIAPFAPTIVSSSQSRYVAGATALPSSPVSSTYSNYFYKYLAIFKRNIVDPVSVGDVLYMTSDVINTTLVVNRVLNIGSYNYIYVYTNFNDNIVNGLGKTNGIITITNLNRYKTTDDIVDRFEIHPVSIGYKLSYDGQVIDISCRFNNKTAYYNMESVVTTPSLTYNMSYADTFLKFGFSPTYNILDYLNNIDTGFTASRVMYSMPIYSSIPGNNSNTFTASVIYLDGTLRTNKLIFGTDLDFEWKTIWINTFVDVTLLTNTGTYSSDRYLVVDKYYDSDVDGYVIEFDKGLLYTINDSLLSVTIESRCTLQQISDDLQLLNGIQRTSSNRNIQSSYVFSNLQNSINNKFNTDSYCKILLSDEYIKDLVSAIIYTDSKYQLSMNVVNLEKEVRTNIISTQNYGGYLQVTCDSPHGLHTGDGVVLSFTGGTYSSEYLNPQYNGFQAVNVLNDIEFSTSLLYGNNPLTGDTGYVDFIKRDVFFNYQPTDISDLGSDKVSKVAIEITPLNLELSGVEFNLINLDLNKYKYQLFDGLTIGELSSKYHWVLEAEISDAIIGKNADGLIWYSGIWKCGRWFGGTWISGTWISGDFYDGIWESKSTKNKTISIEVGNQTISNLSKWYDGRWFAGTWNGGTWYNGRRYAGDWNSGIWYNGIWNDGNWNDGVFSGGAWVMGNWKAGNFNSDNKPSYWLDGTWYSGDFENGRWFNGEFRQTSGKKSRFGTKASNSRNAIWDSGKWLSGEFHSLLNIDDNGNLSASDIHKYSYWKTGIWNQGNFYGGIVYSMDFRGGNFHGGIVDDIQVMGVDIPNDKITLNGIFRFNIGDEIWIIDDDSIYSQYPSIGSLKVPKKYKIGLVSVDDLNQNTTLTLIYDLSTLGPFLIDAQFGIDLRLRVVSKFSNANWYSGLWYNGVFSGNFYGGMWYNGSFQGTWGQ